MGSFHVGGRVVEISGKPVKEVVLAPAACRPRWIRTGIYQVEQMYVQYFLPQNRKGKFPLLMWHGGGLTGVTYETKPDGREGWLNYVPPQGLGHLQFRCRRARPLRLAPPDMFKGDRIPALGDPFERFRIGARHRLVECRSGEAKLYPGSQFPVEAYENS